MSEHTPGPWIAVFSKKNGAALRIEAPNDAGVPGAAGSVIRQNGIGIPACGIGKANASLIAAAPDLLAALKIAREYVVRVDGTMSFTEPNNRLTAPHLKAIDAAIAKAEGKSS